MDNQGWIKLHRKLSETSWANKPNYIALWVHLLLKANHKPKEFIWNGKIIIVKEGQMITGRKELSKLTGIKPTTIERILENLEIGHQIEQQKTTKFRLITVLKWEEYQKDRQESGQQTDNKRTTNGHKQECKNDKNEKNNILQPAVAEGFSFKSQLKKMFEDKNRRMPIIAYYWNIKGFNFDNKQKYSAALKRELRPAGDLIGYSNDEIKRTCEWLKNNADFKWTLETVLKYIDEPLENMKAGGKLQTEEDYIKSLKQKHYGAN